MHKIFQIFYINNPNPNLNPYPNPKKRHKNFQVFYINNPKTSKIVKNEQNSYFEKRGALFSARNASFESLDRYSCDVLVTL